MNNLTHLKHILTSQQGKEGAKQECIKEILRYKQYSYQIFNQIHKKDSLRLLIQEFMLYNPLLTAFCKLKPERRLETIAALQAGYKMELDYFIKAGLSFVICDTSNNNEVVSAVMMKDFSVNLGSSQGRKSSLCLRARECLYQTLIKKVEPKIKSLFTQQGKVIGASYGVVKSSLLGQQIFSKVYELMHSAAIKNGFEYMFAFTTSGRAKKRWIKLKGHSKGFLIEIDAKQFQFQGEKPFCLIDEEDRYPAICLKNLRE